MPYQARLAHVFRRRQALKRGARDALGSPMLVLLAGMLAYGSVAHQQGLDVWITSLGSVFIFALPGQIVMQEMLIAGAPLYSIVLAVFVTATRFVTMSITLIPQFHRRDRGPMLVFVCALGRNDVLGGVDARVPHAEAGGAVAVFCGLCLHGMAGCFSRHFLGLRFS